MSNRSSIKNFGEEDAERLDHLRLFAKPNHHQPEYDLYEDLKSSDDLKISEGIILGFNAEMHMKFYGNSTESSDLDSMFESIDNSTIASADLIILKAFNYYSLGDISSWAEALSQLDEINFEEEKHQEESEEFYRLLAHSPYRKLMIIEAFLYKALLHSSKMSSLSEDYNDNTKCYRTLVKLLEIIENTATLGYQGSKFMNENIHIDYVESELMKYFYSVYLEIARIQDVFTTAANRIRDHVFNYCMLYPADLRCFILECVANQEVKYFKKFGNYGNEGLDKLIRNIKKFMKNIKTQLESFPDGVNILSQHQSLIDLITSSEDNDDVMEYYQQFILAFTSKDVFYKFTHFVDQNTFKVKTFTDGELDEYRFFFKDDNESIITEYLKCKDTNYSLSTDYLHGYYLKCLDFDPANGEYLYNLVWTYYYKHEYQNSLLLIEKYLQLNDECRKYNKVKVMIIAAKIYGNVLHRYEDALRYVGDLLGTIEADYPAEQNEKGFSYFYSNIIDKISVNIFSTAGNTFASYALHSDYYQNKVSRLKTALNLLKKAVQLCKTSYQVLTNIGRIYLLLGDAKMGK